MGHFDPLCFNRWRTDNVSHQKALNIFNAALVTPTYYVCFTTATIVTSAILVQGFKGSAISITSVVMSFLQICTGVILLQMSNSAKDIPDAAVFKGDLNQVREIGEQEQPESEPKADAIRGTAAIIRRLSTPRLHKEAEEARRVHEDQMKDACEPVAENETVEWDGLRRRKSTLNIGDLSSPLSRRRGTVHPPLGMSRFPEPDDELEDGAGPPTSLRKFFGNIYSPASTETRSPSSPRPQDPHRSTSRRFGALHKPQRRFEKPELNIVPETRGHNTGAQIDQGLLVHSASERLGRLDEQVPSEASEQEQQRQQRLSPGAARAATSAPLYSAKRRQFSFQEMFRGARAASSSTTDEERVSLLQGQGNLTEDLSENNRRQSHQTSLSPSPSAPPSTH